MSPAATKALHLADLRQRALTQLSAGTRSDAPRKSTSEALSVLFELASSPATAGDALALLHELQVHQVELELQQEELRGARAELEGALARQTERVERAPVGYMTIDDAAVLWEVNLAGARLLGRPRDELLGQSLRVLLPARSADMLQTLLARVRSGQSPPSCELQLSAGAGAVRAVHATADRDTVEGRFLLVLTEPVA